MGYVRRQARDGAFNSIARCRVIVWVDGSQAGVSSAQAGLEALVQKGFGLAHRLLTLSARIVFRGGLEKAWSESANALHGDLRLARSSAQSQEYASKQIPSAVGLNFV